MFRTAAKIVDVIIIQASSNMRNTRLNTTIHLMLFAYVKMINPIEIIVSTTNGSPGEVCWYVPIDRTVEILPSKPDVKVAIAVGSNAVESHTQRAVDIARVAISSAVLETSKK